MPPSLNNTPLFIHLGVTSQTTSILMTLHEYNVIKIPMATHHFRTFTGMQRCDSLSGGSNHGPMNLKRYHPCDIYIYICYICMYIYISHLIKHGSYYSPQIHNGIWVNKEITSTISCPCAHHVEFFGATLT